jgi:hypothetical protein
VSKSSALEKLGFFLSRHFMPFQRQTLEQINDEQVKYHANKSVATKKRLSWLPA